MDQLYEQWLQSQKTGWGEEAANNSVRENGKQIHMPTDYAEEVVSLHVDVQLVSQRDFSWNTNIAHVRCPVCRFLLSQLRSS